MTGFLYDDRIFRCGILCFDIDKLVDDFGSLGCFLGTYCIFFRDKLFSHKPSFALPARLSAIGAGLCAPSFRLNVN